MTDTDEVPDTGEMLRLAMRSWASGVAIVTSQAEGIRHGMTVNSFVSISIEPPLVTVTMNNSTRTCALVLQSSVFAVTVLTLEQQILAELFAGRIPEEADRMIGLATFDLVTGAPLISGGAAFIDCRVVHQYAMPTSTLFIAEVLAADLGVENRPPLLYYNRAFATLAE
jgi:flavin reductase (DIM6/NTAB) family NADH-FMN oxidoreductase RutF